MVNSIVVKRMLTDSSFHACSQKQSEYELLYLGFCNTNSVYTGRKLALSVQLNNDVCNSPSFCFAVKTSVLNASKWSIG